MNLRKVDEYNIGLDLGTGSVGWAVTDTDGELLHFKGRPTWGSRLFPSAKTAAEARAHRGQRRRYDRRRQRVELLQSLFCDELTKVDEDFFIRLNQSKLLKEDRAEDHREYLYPLFNDKDFTECDYYDKFPTIYHLRKYLMENDEKVDIRLIYLAFHNIVKTRGNFLYQDNPSLTAKDANTQQAVERMCSALVEWCEDTGIEITGMPDANTIQELIENTTSPKKDRAKELSAALNLGKENKPMADAISNAVLGDKAEFGYIFGDVGDGSNFSLKKDDAVEEYRASVPDEGQELFESLVALYSAGILMGILKGADGRTISYLKVDEYEKYKADLRLLKLLIKQYAPQEYDKFFRGSHYTDAQWAKDYNPKEAQGYTLYNLKKLSYDAFKKEVKDELEKTEAVNNDDYKKMIQEFEEEQFLRRLKTSDNGSIPYQLHLEEMRLIIDKQAKYYPFLRNEQKKLESLVTFRIPYYVGPLTQKNAPTKPDGTTRFAWSARKEGKEGEKIYPWNWDEIIDKDKSAKEFIKRMTGTCTYLRGEPVLPKCSLLYEKYCVLNELNGATWTQDGDKWHRFDVGDRSDIFHDLFEHGSVTYKKVEDWLKTHNYAAFPHVRGGQGETKFESKLSSHLFFSKLLEVEEFSSFQEQMIEEIILWNTLFEDRDILRSKLQRKYSQQAGGPLSDDQIKAICKKRFSGWGRLSRKLLLEIKADTPDGKRSIMDVLEEGNPFGERIGEAMVFMEVLRDENLGFQKKIDDISAERAHETGGLGVDDLQGSPSLKRTVNQALRIVDEIASIAGKAPKNVYIETTREDDLKKKGKRSTKRYDALKAALACLKDEGKANPDVLAQFKDISPQDIDDRLMLYFSQNGKSMYSGKDLHIESLSTYHIDHIIPQAYIKDDSLENRVLVLPGENERKADNLLIAKDIRIQMAPLWESLHKCKLIGDKKFNNLKRDKLDEKQLKGFINRQLVETSQIVKHTRLMLEEKYLDSNVRSIKAGLSHELREQLGLVKCREANDYHHAHDALLACVVGRFLELYYAGELDNPVLMAHKARAYAKAVLSKIDQLGLDEKHIPRKTSFIIGNFFSNQVDRETGEIWESDKEIARLKRFFNYKDCFISRMPEITSGAFWDATIYSPKLNNKLTLALKKTLPPEKYGAYKSTKFAYFFVYEGLKKKRVLEWATMPVHVARAIESDPLLLLEYAKQDAASKGIEFKKIVLKKIYKYQLIELNGERFFVTGKKEMRNASQFSFTTEEYMKLEQVFKDEEVENTDCDVLFNSLINCYQKYALRLGRLLKLDALKDSFYSLSIEQKSQIIKSLIAVASAKTNMIDLSAIGGANKAGCMQPSYSSELNKQDSSFEIINSSVTGMFERRTKIEL